MIRTTPDQLDRQLRKGIHSSYFVVGNEPLLVQESMDMIRQHVQQRGLTEQFSFSLDAQYDWGSIFNLVQTRSLFAQYQLLILTLTENSINAFTTEQLLKLATLRHQDLVLLLHSHKLTKVQEQSAWFKALCQQSLLINCYPVEQAQLSRWVVLRANQMKLQLDETSNQLLCYYYEGNLLALSQALGRLALLYPDGKLTLPRVEQAVNDAAHFSVFHWIDAMMTGKSHRAWHIVQQLQQEDVEPAILLRTIQRELLLLLTLSHHMTTEPLQTLFDKHHVWQKRRPILTQALQRLNRTQLHQAIGLLSQSEVTLKQRSNLSVWQGLHSLTLLLCGKTLPKSMIHAG